jgi:hypothetical protein
MRALGFHDLLGRGGARLSSVAGALAYLAVRAAWDGQFKLADVARAVEYSPSSLYNCITLVGAGAVALPLGPPFRVIGGHVRSRDRGKLVLDGLLRHLPADACLEVTEGQRPRRRAGRERHPLAAPVPAGRRIRFEVASIVFFDLSMSSNFFIRDLRYRFEKAAFVGRRILNFA